jgi:hypothetical protein
VNLFRLFHTVILYFKLVPSHNTSYFGRYRIIFFPVLVYIKLVLRDNLAVFTSKAELCIRSKKGKSLIDFFFQFFFVVFRAEISVWIFNFICYCFCPKGYKEHLPVIDMA